MPMSDDATKTNSLMQSNAEGEVLIEGFYEWGPGVVLAAESLGTGRSH